MEDLNIPDPPEGADPQTAVPVHVVTAGSPVSQNGLAVSSSVTTLGSTGQVPLSSAPAHLTFTQAPPAASMLNASSSRSRPDLDIRCSPVVGPRPMVNRT